MSRSKLIILALAASVLVASLALAAWLGLRRDAAQRPVDLQSFLDGLVASVGAPPSATSGDALPDLELATLEPYREAWGDALRLRDLAARTPLVVNFWASWCPPCRREAPLLEAAWQKYQGRVQFVGINLRDQEDAALAFIQEFGQSFPSGADPRGEAAIAFGLVGVPTTYFVAQGGRMQTVKVGEITGDELEQRLQALLSAQVP